MRPSDLQKSSLRLLSVTRTGDSRQCPHSHNLKRTPTLTLTPTLTNRCALSMPRQSLLLSLVSIMEILLDPKLDPPTTDNISVLSAHDIVMSDGFCDILKAILQASAGSPTLLTMCLSLLESLMRDDPSSPDTLGHMLSNGLIR
jgi:hypothetical protein